VRGAYREEDTDAETVAAELAETLEEVAAWLGLDAVAVEERGDLAPLLASALGQLAPNPASASASR
jgi:hypothetical protein